MSSKRRFHTRSRDADDSDPVKKRRRGLKQQIRDTKRLLSKPDLPETVRQVKERVLKMMVDELQEKQRVIHNRKINKKYKMIKFFEKRKIVRKLRSLLRQLSSCAVEDPQRKELLSQVYQLRADLNYIVHYPSGEKYVALFPTSSQTGEKALAAREDLFKAIQSQVHEGTLPDAINLEFSSETASLVPQLDHQFDLVVGGSVKVFDSHSVTKQNDASIVSSSETSASVASDDEDQATSPSHKHLKTTSPESLSKTDRKRRCLVTDGKNVIASKTNKKSRTVSATKGRNSGKRAKSRDTTSMTTSEIGHSVSSVREPKLKKRRVLASCDVEGPVEHRIKDDPFFI